MDYEPINSIRTPLDYDTFGRELNLNWREWRRAVGGGGGGGGGC